MFFLTAISALIIDFFGKMAVLMAEVGKIMMPILFIGLKSIFNFFTSLIKKQS